MTFFCNLEYFVPLRPFVKKLPICSSELIFTSCISLDLNVLGTSDILWHSALSGVSFVVVPTSPKQVHQCNLHVFLCVNQLFCGLSAQCEKWSRFHLQHQWVEKGLGTMCSGQHTPLQLLKELSLFATCNFTVLGNLPNRLHIRFCSSHSADPACHLLTRGWQNCSRVAIG